jgi:hypothetical protein
LVLAFFHRVCRRGEGSAHQVTAPLAGAPAVVFEAGRYRVSDLPGCILVHGRNQVCWRVDRRYVHDRVQQVTELLFRIA